MNNALSIATSGLVAQRAHLDVIAANLAMRESMTRNEVGDAVPYRRRVPLFAPGGGPDGVGGAGVHVAAIVEDPSPFGIRWDPDHPDAMSRGDLRGYVLQSNVDVHAEMVNALTAARAYEANLAVMDIAKSMASETLRLIG